MCFSAYWEYTTFKTQISLLPDTFHCPKSCFSDALVIGAIPINFGSPQFARVGDSSFVREEIVEGQPGSGPTSPAIIYMEEDASDQPLVLTFTP